MFVIIFLFFFLSQICRAAYELLLSRDPDAPNLVRSLDCHHFYSKHLQIPKLATQDHIPEKEEEISFRKADLIKSYGDLYNGYSLGTNMNSSTKGKIGLYPTYKVANIVVPNGHM